MSEQELQRPPTSGSGSGVAAWREYAAAVTESPVEGWSNLTRDEIIELLDSEGADQPAGAEASDQGDDTTAGVGEGSADDQPATASAESRRGAPQWMVPTDDGWVPETQVRRRR